MRSCNLLLTVSIVIAGLVLGNAPSKANEPAAESSVIRPRFGGQFTGGTGVGFDTSFGTIEGFIPLTQTPGTNLSFAQARLNLSTQTDLGGSVLLGYRQQNSGSILGGYLGYDFRDTGNASFNQLSAGLELLFDRWEFRLNGYLPVGTKRKQLSETLLSSTSTFAPSTPTFTGNNLIIGQLINGQQTLLRNSEAALSGLDAEVGIKLAQWSPDSSLRSYLGLYYYSVPSESSFVGVRGRLVAQINPNFQMGVAVQSDREFGTTAAVSLGFSFAGNSRKLPRLGESVMRQDNIAILQQSQIATVTVPNAPVLALNPTTNQPWFFQHVRLGTSGGTGTFESPVGTLQAGLNNTKTDGNSIVYVQAGTNPGIPAFTVPNNVQVLSTAPTQTLATTQAPVQLPLSGTGALPIVQGTFAPGALQNQQGVITLGSNTVLSGFDVRVIDPGTNPATGGGRRGIVAKEVSNVSILNNQVTNAFGEGIYLENVTGRALVDRNTVIGTRQNSDTTAGSNFTEYNGSIFLVNNRGAIDLTVSNNRIEMATNASLYDVDGIEVNLCRDFNGESPNPFPACTAPATAIVRITDNSVNGNGATGGAEGIDTNVGSLGTANFIIQRNTLTNIPDNGITYDANENAAGESTAKATFLIEQNTIDRTARDGIDIDVRGSAETNATIRNNTLTNITQRGFDIETVSNGKLNLLLESNSVTNIASGSNRDLLRMRVGSTPTIPSTTNPVSASIVNAIVRSNTSSTRAAAFTTANASNLCLQLRSNVLTGTSTFTRGGTSTFRVENTLSTNTPALTAPGTTSVAEGACPAP